MEKSKEKQSKSLMSKSPGYTSKDEYRYRRRLEMKRRFGILQSKRNHLERELDAIKNSMFLLDQQMRTYEAYEQLSIQ